MKVVALLVCALFLGPAFAQPKPAAVTPDGGRYFGPLRDGKLHGSGRLEWPNGDVYEGGFVDGLMSGRGVLRQASGTRGEGEFRNGSMNGPGRMVDADGAVYTGEFRDDRYHGQGRYEIPEREVYEGEFRQGYYWGRGELSYPDGRRYRGDFVRSMFQGKGRLEGADGEVYEGDFSANEFTGQGTLTRRDGRYEGGFSKWRFHGKGRYTDGGGNTYEGDFVNGVLEGRGTIISTLGDRYDGDVRQWRFHGEGVLRRANGDLYRGAFANGMFEGQGTLTYGKPRPGGPAQESGVWRFGVLESQAREQRRQASANVELALYNQRATLSQAIGALKPRDPARINLFLLAIAGDGSQEVFRREVEFVLRQFGERFGTDGRSIALINSRSTVSSAPMATATSIRESLAALAARMDKEQDILFLFLTSHGSREHEFVLNQNSMDLPDLPAAQFGRLLRESGVRWKVVVISACYGGGFIDALKDDGTLVIAAARSDRQSFGCADENDFTYFGRAYFKEALPQASSFQDAFRKAEALVREMEVRELKAPAGTPADERHSLPQLWSPPAIERQLQRWWAQLR